MINEQSIIDVLKSNAHDAIDDELIQKQIILISEHLNLPHRKVELVARLVLEMGLPWDCPNCEFRTCVGYQGLIDSFGNPICPNCNKEME